MSLKYILLSQGRSSRGSTPKASASLRTVRGWAVRSPLEEEIVACVVSAIFASSDCESIRSMRSCRSRSPSTVCHPGIPPFIVNTNVFNRIWYNGEYHIKRRPAGLLEHPRPGPSLSRAGRFC